MIGTVLISFDTHFTDILVMVIILHGSLEFTQRTNSHDFCAIVDFLQLPGLLYLVMTYYHEFLEMCRWNGSEVSSKSSFSHFFTKILYMTI